MPLHLNKEHVLFQVERPQEAIKTCFLVTTKEKSKAELKQTFLERTQRHFGKLVFSFQWDPPLFFGRFTKIIKTIAHNTKRRRPRFRKNQKLFFLSIRYRKTSQTQDVKSQTTKRRVRKLAQPKRDSAFEQETRIVSSGEIWGSSQNSFFSYNQSNKPTRAQKDILGTCSTSFWKVSVLLKKQELFLKYSISQDISNAGCKEPKYRT